jgi:hypothetical protein
VISGAAFRQRVRIVRDSQELQALALALSVRVLTVDVGEKNAAEDVQRILREVERLTGELRFNVAMVKGLS